MFAQLLSGEVLTLSSEKCALEQLSAILCVPEFRIELFCYGERIHVLVRDHQVEWKEAGVLVRDTRGFPYKKYHCVINGETYEVYEGSGGYSYGKIFAHTAVAEIIHPIRKWYTREEIQAEIEQR